MQRKKLLSLFVCLLSAYMLQAQDTENAISFTQLQRNVNLSGKFNNTPQTVMSVYNADKYQRFKKLRNGGIILTCVGAGLITTGVVLIASGAKDADVYFNDSYYENNDDAAKVAGGAVCVIFGAMSTGGGITMWSIGARKMKQYGYVSIKPTKNGLGLAYSL